MFVVRYKKTMEQNKISYKVAYLSSGTDSRILDLLKVDSMGITEFIDKAGVLHDRAPVNGEQPARIVLDTIESYVDAQGQNRKRVYTTLSYFKESASGEMLKDSPDQVVAKHNLAKNAHTMLKSHQEVAWRGEDGNDKNPNRCGYTVMFEIIEESQNILNQVEKNSKVTEAMSIATDMFKNNQKDFIDFCYAYGIRPIQGVPIENLYNEVSFKIQMNPNHFFETMESKDREYKIVLAKAKEAIGEDGLPLINLDGGLFYLAGEIIGSTEEEVINHLKTHPLQRKYVFGKIGAEAEVELEVQTLPPVSEENVVTKQAKVFKKRVDAARVEEMERSVKYTIKKYHDAIKKDGSEGAKADALLEFDKAIESKRPNFFDIVEAYDTFVEEQKKFLK